MDEVLRRNRETGAIVDLDTLGAVPGIGIRRISPAGDPDDVFVIGGYQ